MCCQAMMASCLACEADLSVAEYCEAHPSVDGCSVDSRSGGCIVAPLSFGITGVCIAICIGLCIGGSRRRRTSRMPAAPRFPWPAFFLALAVACPSRVGSSHATPHASSVASHATPRPELAGEAPLSTPSAAARDAARAARANQPAATATAAESVAERAAVQRAAARARPRATSAVTAATAAAAAAAAAEAEAVVGQPVLPIFLGQVVTTGELSSRPVQPAYATEMPTVQGRPLPPHELLIESFEARRGSPAC